MGYNLSKRNLVAAFLLGIEVKGKGAEFSTHAI